MDVIGTMGRIVLSRRRFQTEALRPFGITFMQFHLIALARRRGALRPSDAAAELSCDRPTASVIAENCVAQGWLVRRRSASDRRSRRLLLTGEGEELLDRIEAAQVLSPRDGDPLDALDEAEKEAFLVSLELVMRRAEGLFGA
ncbi:MAG: MarR family winged helix-turn-helix transcriptional regulator [Spirochaetaceae bacterium]|nr:MarR family winged helix-turn-helix transcriptional regulator [Spirochaetaceae bacterium]